MRELSPIIRHGSVDLHVVDKALSSQQNADLLGVEFLMVASAVDKPPLARVDR